jgi:hypothetical protein
MCWYSVDFLKVPDTGVLIGCFHHSLGAECMMGDGRVWQGLGVSKLRIYTIHLASIHLDSLKTVKTEILVNLKPL